MDDDELVLTGQGVEFIRRRMERFTRQLAECFGKPYVVSFRAVDARADSRAAHGQIAKEINAPFQHFLIAFDHAGPAAELLPQGKGRSVLQMGAADFNDVGVFFRLGVERMVQRVHGREQLTLDEQERRYVERRREYIVGALRMVDVVVRMNVDVFSLFLQQLHGPVRDDFVHVHVELRAAAGHPYGQGEIAVQFSGQHVVTGGSNRVGPVAVYGTQFLID